MFGDVVGGEPRHRYQAGHRRGVDNVPLTLVAHDRQERSHAVDHPIEVDANCAGPLVHRAGPRVAVAGDAGVVAEYVRRSVRLEGKRGKCGDRRLRRGVARHRRDVGTLGGEPLLHRLESDGVNVGQHHLHSLGAEHLGQREADSTGRAGDDGDLADEILHLGIVRCPRLARSERVSTMGDRLQGCP